MAVFNPQVQDGRVNDPNYFKYSDSISQPLADKSKGLALSTAGEAIEGTAKLADSTIKDVIKADVYSRVDPLTDKWLDALTNVRNDPSGQGGQGNPVSPVGDYGPNQAPVNLMENNDRSIPTGLANGINTVQRLAAAEASGKPTKTLIDQKLYAELKDLRSTYVGYRDYIDQEMKKATGRDVANDLESSLREDIARQGATANKETAFWQHQIVSNAGFQGSDAILADYNRTGNSTKVMQWLSYNQGMLNKISLSKSVADLSDANTKAELQRVTEFAQDASNHAVTTFHANAKIVGSNGSLTPDQIHDQMVDFQAHPEKANEVVVRQLGQQYEAYRAQAYQQTWKLLNQRGDDGRSYVDKMGVESAKKMLDNTIGASFDATSKMIYDKQFGAAYTLQNAQEATINNKGWSVLNGNTIGDRVATAAVFNKLAPNLAPVLFGSALSSGLDKDVVDFLREQKKQAVAQTGGNYQGADGKVYSLAQSMDEVKKYGAVTGTPITGEAYKDLLSVTKAITDKNATEASKTNAIKFLYDPVANKGVMSKYMDDYYDHSKGGMVQGRSSAFATLTGEDVTRSVWDHAQSHPGDWSKYSTWAKGEFANQFGETVRNVNKIQEESNDGIPLRDLHGTLYKIGMEVPSGAYKISWDNVKHELTLLNHDGSALEGIKATPLNSAYRYVSNLNMGLKNMSNIAKTEGSNIDAYLFKVMRDNGFTPTNPVDGVGAEIMKALIVSNGGKVKKGAQAVDAPTVPTSRFAPEDVGGDLQSFLTNPAGSQSPTGASPEGRRGVIRGNLSDSEVTGIQIENIPDGADLRQYYNHVTRTKKP